MATPKFSAAKRPKQGVPGLMRVLCLRQLRIVIVVFFMVVDPTSAQVFHSGGDDGNPNLTTSTIDPGQSLSLYLYYATGPTATATGQVCHTGDGHELCAVDFELSATGTIRFVSFIPDGSKDISFDLRDTSFGLNVLDTSAPTIGTFRIGELTVQADAVVCSSSCEVSWQRSEKVSAALKLSGFDFIPADDTVLVDVPEPAAIWLIASGSLLLAILRRRRAERTRS